VGSVFIAYAAVTCVQREGLRDRIELDYVDVSPTPFSAGTPADYPNHALVRPRSVPKGELVTLQLQASSQRGGMKYRVIGVLYADRECVPKEN